MDEAIESKEQVEEQPITFDRFLRYFLWLGTFGLGGPIATVGYMQRHLVEKRGWLEKQDFLNGIALGQTMPGPLAAQVAMWVGYLRRGALGALAVSAAAGAIAGATVVLTRQAVVDLKTTVIALVALLLLWCFKVKEPLLVLGAGAAGLLLH